MAQIKSQTCEGTDTVTLTTGNSGGPDQVTGVAGAPKFSTAQFAQGASSLLCATTAAADCRFWMNLASAATKSSVRFYLRMSASPPATRVVYTAGTTGGTANLRFQVTTARALSLLDSASVEVLKMSTVPAVNAWYRYQIQCDSGTSYVKFSIFDASGALVEEKTQYGGGHGSSLQAHTFGDQNTDASWPSWWWDAIAIRDELIEIGAYTQTLSPSEIHVPPRSTAIDVPDRHTLGGNVALKPTILRVQP